MSNDFIKYPRTPHIAGSRIQSGDDDMEIVLFESLHGKYLVLEEKMDGANCAISFDSRGNLQLQSRGHVLTGGPREKHFNVLKQWSQVVQSELRPVLGKRYIMYGEWMYAKHTVFYDYLSHYFMEFDVYDRETGNFLSTEARLNLLGGLHIQPVLVLAEGMFHEPDTSEALAREVGLSRFKTVDWIQTLRKEVDEQKLNWDKIWGKETDQSPYMEGLYVKWEEDGVVKGRYKFVRSDFVLKVANSEEHWLARPIIPNQLRPDVDIYNSRWTYGGR